MPALVVTRFLVPLCLALDPVPLPRGTEPAPFRPRPAMRERTRVIQIRLRWLTRVRRCLRPSSIQPGTRVSSASAAARNLTCTERLGASRPGVAGPQHDGHSFTGPREPGSLAGESPSADGPEVYFHVCVPAP